MNGTPLTIEQAQKLGGAMHRLSELSEQTILTPTHEAEKKGLLQFIQTEVLAHADELVASWFAVHTEYEPLIHVIAAVMNRSNAIIERANAARRQQEAKSEPEPQPENVIKLERLNK